ncbi:hypothetical protein BGZ50_002860 [Haplosporangium sp. Z 11]|nr:hypothetical protein BGZ50_002860 [Haplosporangium sp. Z 11]
MEKSRYSIIPPRIVGRIFIWSDITTFLIQIAAGGLMGGARNNLSLVKAGDTMFLVGVCAQGACYFLFTVLLTVTLRRLVSERQRAGLNRSGRNFFLIVLDAVPLVLAIGIWAIVWPSVPLDKIAAQVRDEAQTFYMESGNSRLRLPSVNSSVGN